MESIVQETDKFVNPFSWNTVMIRDGVPYSVNHYRAGLTWARDEAGERIYKEERVEIRYSLDRERDFANLQVDPESLGYEFNARGYRKGSSFDREVK